VMLFEGAGAPYTLNKSYEHFPLILRDLPPLIARVKPDVVKRFS